MLSVRDPDVAATLQRFRYWYAGSARPALDGVDLSIDSRLTAITGVSGSGKSTLLRVFNGLVPHFHGGKVQGHATVFGHDVLRTPTRRLAQHVGFLFQDPELQTVYATVERDVAFGLENLGFPRLEMIARVDEALYRCGIAGLRHRRVNTLSGGERQRLALAGVLALRPRLLALDEPLAQLDPEGAQSFLATLDDVIVGGTRVVMSEHRLANVLPRADRALTLDHGRLVERAAQPLRPGDTARTALSSLSRQPADAIWQLSNVSAGPTRDAVLSDVDLAGAAGEVVVLTGPNGGGKTTLLRTIAGLIAPLEGRVERSPGRVAYLPQNPTALLHRPTVRAEVELTLRRSGEDSSPDRILNELALTHVADRYPRDLSTGERQRAALAAVLAGSPRLVLLDEPTRGMDDSAREALRRIITRIKRQAGSVVLATHDTDLAGLVADRTVRISHGAAREVDYLTPVPV